jgi:repressor LexA
MFALPEHLCYTNKKLRSIIDAMGGFFMKKNSDNPRGITDKQREIYDYLLERTQNGVPPSVREICSAVGLSSTSSVQANLAALESAGYISRDPMLKRSIRIAGQAENVTQVPLLGTVAAGQPILAFEDVECYIPYAGHTAGNKSLFALRIRGESMINAGILDGDIVFVEKTPVASNGEIVVALIEDEATVKTFFKEKGHFRLQPENDVYEPILCDEVILLGKVVGLLRQY